MAAPRSKQFKLKTIKRKKLCYLKCFKKYFPFKNMITEYLALLNKLSVLEFFLQAIICYNFWKIITTSNFYYILAYFFLFILFNGILLIFFECDLIAILLWIVYFGVLIIFFIYSLIWYDSDKHLKQNYFSYSINLYFLLILFFFILFLWNFNIISTIDLDFLSISYVNYYELLYLNLNEELDGLGYAIIMYSSFNFLICTYILFLACCASVALILNSKKIKYWIFYCYLNLLKLKTKMTNIMIYKQQNFFIQDYETTYQLYSLNKNYKIINKFHRLKNFKRRI